MNDLVKPVEAALIEGDLSKLTAEQRLSYYRAVCESVGLNPLTKPFDYLHLNGKLVLYAKRDATDQLRKLHSVSITALESSSGEGVYCVKATAQDKGGRTDSSIGAVPTEGLKGANLANAWMKAETKAKRRVTLSICGLGLLDETELETIPGAAPAVVVPVAKEIAPPRQWYYYIAGMPAEKIQAALDYLESANARYDAEAEVYVAAAKLGKLARYEIQVDEYQYRLLHRENIEEEGKK